MRNPNALDILRHDVLTRFTGIENYLVEPDLTTNDRMWFAHFKIEFYYLTIGWVEGVDGFCLTSSYKSSLSTREVEEYLDHQQTLDRVVYLLNNKVPTKTVKS